MRLTLFFLFLFSILGGSHVSAAHATVGSEVFFHPVKQKLSSQNIPQGASLHISVGAGTSAKYLTAVDVEDEEDSDNLSFRKSKTVLASGYIASLSRIHTCRIPSIAAGNISSCKYITQRNLRI